MRKYELGVKIKAHPAYTAHKFPMFGVARLSAFNGLRVEQEMIRLMLPWTMDEMGIKNAKWEWKEGTTDAHTKLGMLKSRKRIFFCVNLLFSIKAFAADRSGKSLSILPFYGNRNDHLL